MVTTGKASGLRRRFIDHFLPLLRQYDRPRTRRRGSYPVTLLFATILLGFLVPSISAAFVNFENCLEQSIVRSNPVQLQFIPLNVTAQLQRIGSGRNLNVTVYGNVTGSESATPPPPPGDPRWQNPNETLGKIIALSESNNIYSTFFTKLQYLSYTPYDAIPSQFCPNLVHGVCPLGPAFDANSSSDISQLPAFSVAHSLYSSYAFTTIIAELRVHSAEATNAHIACVSILITPDLGNNLANLLAYIPLAILVFVGLATVFAAMYSPWGSTDVFRWTSNYGRDADLLRLVTPGFGDCLQYIQFVFLTASLSLAYPGYYQPVVSQVSWSALMFNTSFVSHGNGTTPLVDGMYVTTGKYGLDRMRQLVGMSSVKDIWAGMMIWLLVIIVAVVVLIQIGFLLRWGYRHLSHTQEEDLRAKNMPFTVGNVIRIVFNYFMLPLVALSTFQLVVSRDPPSQPITTAATAVVVVVLVAFSVWLLRLLATIRPRSYLFDDLPTVLLYGPLYNTYTDDAAPFTMIPLFLQFVRGVAIGAVQPSGIAQLVLLAICEVIFLLTLHAFRPFYSPTSMNAYHTLISAARLLTTLLSVTFAPSLGITEGAKGWIGYVILIVHAAVLIFCFLLNAIQTIVEVAARLTGAGGDGASGGAARGGLVKVFGMRQLSKRVPRRDGAGRHSLGSEATFLSADRSQRLRLSDGRPRSTSGSSALLLNRHVTSDGRASVGLESASALGGIGHNRSASGSAYTPTTPGAASPFSMIHGETHDPGPADPYYRPPRIRRPTLEGPSPGARSRVSTLSADWANKRWSQVSRERGTPDEMEGPTSPGRGTPVPAYFASRELSDVNLNDPRRPPTDYAVREVDYYYGVRGPALSSMPSRRLGTGPADPTGPIASAASWFRGLFGGKTKEKGKGFEVVRSSRVPGPRLAPDGMPEHEIDGYRDEITPAREGTYAREQGVPNGSNEVPLVDIEHASDAETHDRKGEGEEDSLQSDSESSRKSPISPIPPSLPQIDTVGGIELPSRIGSKASSRPSQDTSGLRAPEVPRKSSKRPRAALVDVTHDATRLSAITASPPVTPGIITQPRSRERLNLDNNSNPGPTSRSSSPRMPFGSEQSTEAGSRSSSMLQPQNSEGNIAGSSAAAASKRTPSPPVAAQSVTHHRQTSLGYVQQHRASDSIYIPSPPAPGSMDFRPSSAEIVDERAAAAARSASDSSGSR
ncbi:MAG: hypothetical protein M1816_004057 [Peltula sp. TS41687]|nr:MAG: hypothetical protein M1816_004057 [Peltula sp. TS41687]